MKKALKHNPEMVRAYVVKEIAALCKEMDMKKTINTDEEMGFVCRTILDDHPTLKVEELKLALDRIRKGEFKVYERLKGPEILIAVSEYEAVVRAPILEDLHKRQRESERTLHKKDWMKRALMFADDAIGTDQDQPPKGHGVGSRLRKRMDG